MRRVNVHLWPAIIALVFAHAPSALADDPPCRVIGVAVEADYPFVQGLFGGDAAAAEDYIHLLIDSISEVFEAELNVSLEAAFVRAWDTPQDPYTATDATGLLSQFRAFWNANMGHVERDAAVLLTGRNLSGGVQEIQFLDSLCDANTYGLIANLNGEFPLPLQGELAGNEDPIRLIRMIGTFLSARPLRTIAPTQDPCWPSCDGSSGTLFSACDICAGGTANIRLEFHSVNRSRMLSFLDGVQCDLACPCAPDWNGDGVVDSDDLIEFLSDWSAGGADYNGDGVTDSDDLFEFLSDWSTGC